jgi:ribosomal protein L37AE/L43A
MLSNFIPKFSEITELVKKGATLEAQQKILELQTDALKVAQENISLKEKVSKLEDALKVHGKISYEQPSYWIVEGEIKSGPFCQCCYDNSKSLIRLQGNGEGWWECKSCKNTYTDKDYTSGAVIVGDFGRSIPDLGF